MGVVFSARHIQLRERVALKLLIPNMLSNHVVVERFAREARAAVRIKSEHVVRVFDVGCLPSGAPYMVMEYLAGNDLRYSLKNNRYFEIDQAIKFILQACEAVAEAHSLGIVHRDLKPENLFCITRPDGGLSIKVLDFGISKVCVDEAGSIVPALTRSIGLIGTPLYASPEQIVASRDVDSRADIWSIGVVLYELLTCRLPFNGAGAVGHYAHHAEVTFPSMRAHRPALPEALEAVIRRCLGKTRGERYANVAELALALLPFAPLTSRESVQRICGVLKARYQPPQIAPPTETLTNLDLSAKTHVATQSRAPNHVGLIAAVVLGLLVVAVGSVFALRALTRTSPSVIVATVSTALSVSPSHPASLQSSPPPPLAPPEVSSLPSSAPITSQPVSRSLSVKVRTNPSRSQPASTEPVVTKRVKLQSDNCDPPYNLDNRGRKVFKPECFTE
jgi:serine/threonine-protein kinase